MKRIYKKEHESKKARESHKSKIEKRGGRIIREYSDTIEYDFPASKIRGKKKFGATKKIKRKK